MSLSREFENIDVLLNNQTETTGVDCFSLAVIKLERQMRRLFTYSLFQFPCFTDSDIPVLRKALVDQRRAYFEGFIYGMDALHPQPVSQFIGADYAVLFPIVCQATDYRNKIFHGQLTPNKLKTADLLYIVKAIRDWCRLLGDSTEHYFGYSGFTSSFRKASESAFCPATKIHFQSFKSVSVFLLSTSSAVNRGLTTMLPWTDERSWWCLKDYLPPSNFIVRSPNLG